MTQLEFAELLDVSRVTVANWEAGRKMPGPVQLLLECIKRRPSQLGPTLEQLRDERLGAVGKVSVCQDPPFQGKYYESTAKPRKKHPDQVE